MPLSIVIPAFNEGDRLARTLQACMTFLRERRGGEVVVVDDGSRDHTAQIAESVTPAVGVRVQVLRNAINRGKGYSVRRGLLACRQSVALFADADLSTPLSEAPKLLALVEQNQVDIALGSRALDRRLIERTGVLYRDLWDRSFNVAVRTSTKLPFVDTQCGFKAMHMAKVRPLLEALRTDGYGFDVELLMLAQAAGLRLAEVPVRWAHTNGSKLHLAKDGSRMLLDAGLAAWRLRRGGYHRALSKP